MTADGFSSLLCKIAALLLAGAAHALLFRLARVESPPPPLVQPAATRVFILPAVVPPPLIQVPTSSEPEPKPEPEPEPPAPEPILEQEESSAEVPPPPPEPDMAPSDPAPELEPEPEPPPPEPETEPNTEPEFDHEPPPPKPASDPEPVLPETPVVEQPPAHPQPEVVAAPDDSDGVADVQPSLTRPIKPEYPLQARQEQWEGDVVCSALVSKRGTVLEASVANSSGYEILDAAALKAVRTARFVPAQKRGRPVELRVRLTISFRLDERR